MTEIFCSGPAGRLECLYQKSEDPKAPCALILHPHPVYGGNMHNKVIFNTYKILAKRGFSVLRFNFRGVGRSEGRYSDGAGELTDAGAVLDWLQFEEMQSKFTLIVGFSFGAWIAMQLMMRRPEIKYFIAVSPPVNKFDFSFLSQCPISGLIIQGDQDSIVTTDSVLSLHNKISKHPHIKVDLKIIHEADHFFRLKMAEFNAELDEYVGKLLLNKNSNTQNSTSKNTNGEAKKIFLD